MLRTIWQYLCNDFTRRRFGIDNADIQHVRADLRFRLALVEYAYFGRSGRKVARSLIELKSLLGDKAIHRYLRSLDPDLRTQFVERFQNKRRQVQAHYTAIPTGNPAGPVHSRTLAAVSGGPAGERRVGSNVVSIKHAVRRFPEPERSKGPVETHLVDFKE